MTLLTDTDTTISLATIEHLLVGQVATDYELFVSEDFEIPDGISNQRTTGFDGIYLRGLSLESGMLDEAAVTYVPSENVIFIKGLCATKELLPVLLQLAPEVSCSISQRVMIQGRRITANQAPGQHEFRFYNGAVTFNGLAITD